MLAFFNASPPRGPFFWSTLAFYATPSSGPPLIGTPPHRDPFLSLHLPFFLPEASNFNPKTIWARGEAFNLNPPKPIEKLQALTLDLPLQGGKRLTLTFQTLSRSLKL